MKDYEKDKCGIGHTDRDLFIHVRKKKIQNMREKLY